MTPKYCYCCSNKSYSECCESYILGVDFPETPEQLMRSRYTAYSLCNVTYVQTTMAGKALLNFDYHASLEFANSVEFVSLEVVESINFGSKGTVEFLVTYLDQNKKLQVMQEKSLFECINGSWFYVDGAVNSSC